MDAPREADAQRLRAEKAESKLACMVHMLAAQAVGVCGVASRRLGLLSGAGRTVAGETRLVDRGGAEEWARSATAE